MAFAVDNLRGQVLRRPAQGLGIGIGSYVLLREPEICQLRITVLVNKDILRLETIAQVSAFWYILSVDDEVLVQVIYGEDDLRAIELGDLLIKLPDAGEVKE
jgi:hypothetical protein